MFQCIDFFLYKDVQHHLLKRLLLHFLCIFVKIQLTIYMCFYFWTVYGVLLFYSSFSQYHTILITIVFKKSWNHVSLVLQLCSFKKLFGFCRSFYLHINFKSSLLISFLKKVFTRIVTGIALNHRSVWIGKVCCLILSPCI